MYGVWNMIGIKKKDILFIIKSFIIWRLGLLVIQFFAFKLVPLQNDFLGGGMERYLKNPYFWSHLNFDGEHYLSIAMNGYKNLQYFFFPLFPLFVKIFAKYYENTMFIYAAIGQVISNISLVIALLGFYKLLEDNKNIAKRAVLLLILFPTSFYLISFYTESLFLTLCVWAFYFAKQKKWFIAFLLAGLSSATRIVGLALVAGLLTKYLEEKNIVRQTLKVRAYNLVEIFKIIAYGLLGVSGLLVYMYFLKVETGDPLYFFTNVGIYGQQRSAGLVILPQVFYRYIFRILPNIDYSYFPAVFTTWLEFVSACIFGGLLILSLFGNLGYGNLNSFKMSWGYLIFSGCAYLIPTFSGSFSSIPRYVLVVFPVFFVFSKISFKISRKENIMLYTLLIAVLTMSFSLFVRGYWIS